MPRVLRTPDAEESRLDIWCYLLQQSGSHDVADRFLDTLDEKCRLIATHPRMGRPRPDLTPDVRSVSVGAYVILYRPIDDGIELLLVVHGARDIPPLFRARYG